MTVKGNQKSPRTIDQKNHLKWTDNSGRANKIAYLEFWLTANGTIVGKFGGLERTIRALVVPIMPNSVVTM